MRNQLRVLVFAMVVVAVLAGSFAAGRMVAGQNTARAQEAIRPSSPASPEANHVCYVTNVAAFDNRIHLRCDSGVGSIYYFAHPTGGSNGYTASRMLAVAQTAFALGKPVWVYYVSSSTSNPPGCNTTDCRLLTGVSMVP